MNQAKKIFALASVCALVTFAACTDADVSGVRGNAHVTALAFMPRYSLSGSSADFSEPINRIRLIGREESTGRIVGSATEALDPNAFEWHLGLALTISARTVVRVSVELFSAVDGNVSVLWSGLSQPLTITPAETVRPGEPIDLYPGPLENLAATGISISPDSIILAEGGITRFVAAVSGPPGVQAVWFIADPTIAIIDRNGNVVALRAGITSVIGYAGLHADTARLRIVPGIGRIDVIAGDAQTAVVNQLLRDPLRVRVLDPQGRNMVGIDVMWVVSDNGRMTTATSRTNDQGIATNTWQLGTRAGAQNASACGAAGSCAQFRAVARPDRPHAGVKRKGDEQIATVGTIAGDALTLQVNDQFGNAVAGATVNWAVVGGGTLSATSTVTDAEGTSTVTYTVSTVKGQKAVLASVMDGAIAVAVETFRINAKAGKPDARTTGKTRGDNQEVTVAQVASNALEVTVRDSFANAVEGAVVNYSLRQAGNSASLSAASSTTDVDGKAGVEWNVGTKAGVVLVDYVILDVDGKTLLAAGEFRAVARPGPASNFNKIGDNQTGPPGQAKDVTVEVTDQFGNGVGGLAVTWSANQGNVSNNQTSTDETGRSSNRWTLGNQKGSQSLTANVRKQDGNTVAVQFTATAN